MERSCWRSLLIAACCLMLAQGCVMADRKHQIVVSVADQRLELFEQDRLIRTYAISTSKFGTGDTKNSYRTPLGAFRIARKIGDGAPQGTVFKNRKPTGEVLYPDAPGRDPIVTRILWLRGLERNNRNAFRRYIYIHGTPQESLIGVPSSYGCIRMRSKDIVELFDIVGRGARVHIVPESRQPRRQTSFWSRLRRSERNPS